MLLTVDPTKFVHPARCCRCGGPPRAEAKPTLITSGFDYARSKEWLNGDLYLPICARCRLRRWLMGFAVFSTALISIIAIVFAAIGLQIRYLSTAGIGSLNLFRVAVAVIGFFVVRFVLFILPKWFDTWTLRVRCVRLNHDEKTLTLDFSNPSDFAEVATLNVQTNHHQP